MTPYSLDLRQKIIAALDRGVGSQRTVADLFGVSLAFVERLLQRQHTTGTLAPRPHAGGPPRCLDETDERLIRQCLEQQPDLTLDELRETLGRVVQRLNLP
ncbi:transposase, ISSpo6 orf A [Methylocaldum marinum]|uniref:Transposase, ISSpo6 orf A n=1 Tax=Methylocaldum marinum TaxID=1432792 RepID=A0A250KZN5_9GAMM|nr:IS630 transposase-related protein [Methylocaldum marinum]BBA36944.1 transposase, ISSpo6 orf A [Methylocaldum marinum]